MNDSLSSNSACKSNLGLGVKLQLVSRVNGLLKNLENSLATQNNLLKKLHEKKEISPQGVKKQVLMENHRLEIPHRIMAPDGKILNISTRSLEPSPILDFKTGEQISLIYNNNEYSKRDMSISASSSKLMPSPHKRLEERDSTYKQAGKSHRSGSMSPASPEALNERVNQHNYHHKSAKSLTPPKRKIQFQISDDNKLSMEDLEDEQLRTARGFQIQKEKLQISESKENYQDNAEASRKGKSILKAVDRKLNLEESIKSLDRTSQTQKTRGKLDLDQERSTVEKSGRKGKGKAGEQSMEKVEEQFTAMDKIKKNLSQEEVLRKRMLEHRKNMKEELNNLINECFTAEIDFQPRSSKGTSYLKENLENKSVSGSKKKKGNILIESAEIQVSGEKKAELKADRGFLQQSLNANLPTRSTSPVSKIDRFGKMAKTARLFHTEEKELRNNDAERPELRSIVFASAQKQSQKSNLIKRNKESIVEQFKQIDELFESQKMDFKMSISSPLRKEKELRKEIVHLSDRKTKTSSFFDSNFVFSQKRSKLSTPTFDDSENRVLLSKLHRQKISSKKSGKLYFLNDVDEKLSDRNSKKILSSKSSSSVLFNFENQDCKPSEATRLNTYSKDQKRLNADFIFQEKNSRLELLQREKERSIEMVQSKIKTKLFASQVKKSSNFNV